MDNPGIFLLQCLQGLLSLLASFFYALVDAFSPREAFNAEFGKERHVASRFNRGFYIGTRRLSIKDSRSNLLITGITGSGKTSKLLIPTLLMTRNSSIIINDVSGELLISTSGRRAQFSTVKVLNFSDSSKSCGYNPLAHINRPQDINRIAHLLVATTLDKGGSSDPFWSLSVKSLLSIFIRLVLLQDESRRNLTCVLELIHRFAISGKEVDLLIAQARNEKLLLDYQSLISTSEKTLAGIISSAKASLQIFELPEVAKVTSYNSIDFDKFRKHSISLYLQVSVPDQKMLSCLVACFFEQLYGYMLGSLPAKTDLDTFFVIEEASSTYISLLPLALANGRKHFLGTIVCVQSRQQLKSMYKDEAVNISANCCTQVHLSGQTAIEDLREIEALGGKCIYKDDKGTERVKQLITADEIRLLPANRTIIVANGQPLIKGRVSPYYRNLVLSSYAKIPPVELQGDMPNPTA